MTVYWYRYSCVPPQEHKLVRFTKRQIIASLVCACVIWDTLAARHLTASFLSAVLSLAPLAAPVLGWQSAGCLHAAFPCLSPPEQKRKDAKLFVMGEALWCNPENVRSGVCEGTLKLLQLTVASVSNNTFEGSKSLLDFTTHTMHPLKPKLKWQHMVQILINYAVMHFFSEYHFGLLLLHCFSLQSSLDNGSCCNLGKSY